MSVLADTRIEVVAPGGFGRVADSPELCWRILGTSVAEASLAREQKEAVNGA